jgi:hypothetical protein
MRRTLRSVALASLLALGGLVGFGTTSAHAQGFGGYYPSGYGVYRGAYGYGGGYATYPAPLVTTGAFGGYGRLGGYGYRGTGYGTGWGGYGYGRHHHHHHYRGCGCRY